MNKCALFRQIMAKKPQKSKKTTRRKKYNPEARKNPSHKTEKEYRALTRDWEKHLDHIEGDNTPLSEAQLQDPEFMQYIKETEQHARSEKIDAALALLDRALSQSINFDKITRNNLRNQLIGVRATFLGQTLQPQKAYQTVNDEITRLEDANKPVPDRLYITLAQIYFSARDYDRAADILESLSHQPIAQKYRSASGLTIKDMHELTLETKKRFDDHTPLEATEEEVALFKSWGPKRRQHAINSKFGNVSTANLVELTEEGKDRDDEVMAEIDHIFDGIFPDLRAA